MKTVFRKIYISIFVTLVTWVSSYSYVSAEDIDIFVREQTQPNILFVIDTSGSMANPADPAVPVNLGGATRLQAVQAALATVLSTQYDLLNVGVMNYDGNSDAGVGVDLPVSDINQLATAVESGAGVTDPNETYSELLTRFSNTQNPGSGTPTIKALHEAGVYFRGDAVFGGLMMEPHTAWDDGLVSYTGGYAGSAGLRTYENGTLDNSDPAQPRIVGANYRSPIQTPCTSNHIVFLTDGRPTQSNEADRDAIRALTGVTACQNLASLGITDVNVRTHGECAIELAAYLYNNDQSDSQTAQLDNISTHTIGFQLNDTSAETFLDEVAKAGGTNNFINVDSPSTLVTAFQSIVSAAVAEEPRIISRIATTPDLTNLGATRPEVYMPLFSVEPNQPRWSGNLKGYLVNANGILVDTSTPAKPVFMDVDDDADGIDDRRVFNPGVSSSWSTIVDGDDIAIGGLVGILPAPGSRILKTHDDAGDLIDLESGVAALNSNPSNIFGVGLSAAQIDDLIDWVNGFDVFDENGDGQVNDARGYVGDALHSNPVVVSYDQDNNGVIDKAVTFFMTNEGILHAIDDNYFVDKSNNSASEIFAYMPRELLKNIQPLQMNTANTGKNYGLDGPLVFHQEGGIRNLTGNKYLFFGMRRGGNNYYAMDVSNPGAPELMWAIEGGVTAGFEELAQSWSTPMVTQVNDGGTIKTALVFGGGYDVDQDSITTSVADDEGRAIFIVDALTGAKIWSAGPAGATPAHDLELAMTNSVAADLAMIDFDNDSFFDRIYFGDVGGHIWRIDIEGDISNSSNTSGYLLADLHDDTAANNRRFFSKPSVAFTERGSLAISVGSGNRVQPLQFNVNNRFYTLLDPNAAKGDIPSSAPAAFTDANLQNLSTSSTAFDVSNFAGGWFINLQPNEKVFTAPRVILGEVFFTTYIPPENICSNERDGSNLYVVSLDGEPARDLDLDNTNGNELFIAINSTGINGELVPIISPDGKVTGITGNNDDILLIDKITLEDLSWTNNPPPPPPPLVAP